jgi:WD40 repeat protein
MTRDAVVIINFNPQTNVATLTITGGAAGDGMVSSSPAGVSCSITGGTAAGSGCSANYTLNTTVTLTATASSGSYLKAWAGGTCQTAGTGIGKSSGNCAVTLTQSTSVVVSFDKPANKALLGEWGTPFNWPVLSIHASVLPDGKVMTWGRSDRQETLWDPTTGAFQSITRPADLFCSGHALLPDGRLIVMGGHSGTDNIGIAVTNLFDYVSKTWSPGPTMQNGRWYPSVLVLPNGEALVVSGGGTDGTLNTIPEVLSASATSLRPLTGAASSIAYYPMMFVAPNGSVFIAGPDQTTGYLTTAGTGGKSTGPSSAYGYRDYGSAVMYEPGKILLVGGGGPTSSAEKIDLNVGGNWQSAGSMRVARRQMNATLLADGTVLVTGGTNAGGFNNPPTDANVLAAERWNPAGGWTQLARQTRYRLYHSNALLLPDGRVLSVGSGQPYASGLQDDYSGEIFSPPYLFNLDGTPATRPTITKAPASVTYGQSFAIETPNPAAIAKVTFIRLSSVTHATNMNQRLNYLPITTRDASSITVTAPLRAALAPPGHYMVFLLDENGVPSVANIVQIQ